MTLDYHLLSFKNKTKASRDIPWAAIRTNISIQLKFLAQKSCSCTVKLECQSRIQSVYKMFEQFRSLIRRSNVHHWALSRRNIIETLKKFYLYIVLFKVSITYLYNIVSSGIHIFSYFFRRFSCSTFYGLFIFFRYENDLLSAQKQ